MDSILRKYCEQRQTSAVPVLLYKFLSDRSPYFTSGLVELLYHSRVYLSQRDSLNDPFDTRTSVGEATPESMQSLRRILAEHGVRMGATQEQIDKVVRADDDATRRLFVDTLNSTLDTLGIYSLTEEIENPLMWSHYANAHSGVCVAFFAFHHQIHMPHVLPVNYGENYPVIHDLAYDGILEAGPLHKGMAWRYENEWRIVVPNSANTLLSVDPRLTKAIVLGMRSGKATIEAMQSMLEIRNRLGLPLVRLFQAVQQYSKYELSFRQIWPEETLPFETFVAALSDSDQHLSQPSSSTLNDSA